MNGNDEYSRNVQIIITLGVLLVHSGFASSSCNESMSSGYKDMTPYDIARCEIFNEI